MGALHRCHHEDVFLHWAHVSLLEDRDIVEVRLLCQVRNVLVFSGVDTVYFERYIGEDGDVRARRIDKDTIYPY